MYRPAVGEQKLQNFDKKFKICDSKWPTRQVLKTVEEAEKRTQNTHPTRERTPRHRSIPEIAECCHPPRKTSQLPAEPEEWLNR